jgi:RHS repeat-associated protein
LAYSYETGDLNKLIKVSDAANTNYSFKSIGAAINTGASPHYSYDNNGNLITDAQKGITNITYNHLNLPLVIIFTNNASGQPRKIEFIYDATGAKLRKTVFENNVSIETRDYVNGKEYKGGILDSFAITEGAVVRQANNSFVTEYTLKDHLGNARVTYSDANNDGIIGLSDIKQINHYYPFGMNMEGNWNGVSGSNKYQFNGKEWNDDFGLGWNHHDWRFYDVAIGRWVTVDPESEENGQEQFTPYHFALDNPIRYDDPDGRNPLLGALIGAVTDAVVQTIEISLDDSKSFSKDFSFVSVGVSALAGATGVGLANKLGKAGTLSGKLIKLGVESAHDFAASALNQYAKDGEVNLKKAAVDMVAGKIAGEGVGKLVTKKVAQTAEAKVLAKQVVRAEKQAANASGAKVVNRLNRAKAAAEKYDKLVDGKRALTSSVAASGVAGTVANKALGTEKK